jgi:hypothetical protein
MGGGGFGLGCLLVLTLRDLLRPDDMLKTSGIRGAPTVLAMIGAPEGGGGGLGLWFPPVITTSAGGGAEDVDFPSIT